MSDSMDIGLPDKMDINHYDDYMHITRKWFGWSIIFMTVFAVVWNAFLFGFFINVPSEAGLAAKLFPLIHVTVGIGISYYAVAGWLNKTNIYVSQHALEIQHKPLPWFGNKRLLVKDIKQLYSKEKISHSKNGTSVSYEVRVATNSGKDTKLLSGLETSEQALFIEQEIEKYLGIKNQPVRGEI